MAMTFYTGFQWLLIDAANNFGLDKLLFEERIDWAKTNLKDLESFADQAETKPLFIKAVMAIRKAQQGIATGHLVGVDGVCSGVQIMSALTGCIAGASNTGLVDPNRRADAYAATTDLMNVELGGGLSVTRKKAKMALMTSYYGSKATPKEIFGEDTPELNAFYKAAQEVAPGAWELLQDLLASWQPFALEHSWKLPDGYDARIKVMEKKDIRIEVDELDHASFTYEFYENQGSKKGLSNVANMTHSMDAYVLRCMHRRCNYNSDVADNAFRALGEEIALRQETGTPAINVIPETKLAYYIEQWERSGIADVVILPYIDDANVSQLPQALLLKLYSIVEGMLQYYPFELVTVHDEFKAHANNINWVRWQYKEILADIADSNVLDDLLSQVNKCKGTFKKLSSNLGDLIRQSNYGLC